MNLEAELAPPIEMTAIIEKRREEEIVFTTTRNFGYSFSHGSEQTSGSLGPQGQRVETVLVTPGANLFPQALSGTPTIDALGRQALPATPAIRPPDNVERARDNRIVLLARQYARAQAKQASHEGQLTALGPFRTPKDQELDDQARFDVETERLRVLLPAVTAAERDAIARSRAELESIRTRIAEIQAKRPSSGRRS